MSTVTIEKVTKSFGEHVVLREFTEKFEDQEFVTLLGPSGCGKTTMLRIIAGFETPTSGEVYIGNQLVSGGKTFVPPERRSIGMVFQSYAVWPHMNVYDNVAYPLKIRKINRTDIKNKVDRALEIVHLSQYAQRYPNQMSGGQQQRVALARTLNQSPTIILADEPVAALDPVTAHQVMNDFKRINEEMNISILINIHHVDLALKYATRVIGIRAGRIVFDGPTASVTQELLDEVYNGAPVPKAGE